MQGFVFLKDSPEIVLRLNKMIFAKNTEIFWTRSIPTKEITCKTRTALQRRGHHNQSSNDAASPGSPTLTRV